MVLKTLVNGRYSYKSGAIEWHNLIFFTKIIIFPAVRKSVAHMLFNFATKTELYDNYRKNNVG